MLFPLQVHVLQELIPVSHYSNNITYLSCSVGLLAYTHHLQHYMMMDWDWDEVLLHIFQKCLQVSEMLTSGYGSFPKVLYGPPSACNACRQITQYHYVKVSGQIAIGWLLFNDTALTVDIN
jgi:hypothetical protein